MNSSVISVIEENREKYLQIRCEETIINISFSSGRKENLKEYLREIRDVINNDSTVTFYIDYDVSTQLTWISAEKRFRLTTIGLEISFPTKLNQHLLNILDQLVR